MWLEFIHYLTVSVKSFQPCKDKLEKLLKDKLYYVGAVGITIIVIQVIL